MAPRRSASPRPPTDITHASIGPGAIMVLRTDLDAPAGWQGAGELGEVFGASPRIDVKPQDG